jgi:predicted molibdopterin-dependent oxidoreductase YjgC
MESQTGGPTGNRITSHPVLGDLEPALELTMRLDGVEIKAREGETVLAALVASGVSVLRHTRKGSPRRMFCGIGRCTDCVMTVDGVPGVRTCVTRVRDGMKLERQNGAGAWAGGQADER